MREALNGQGEAATEGVNVGKSGCDMGDSPESEGRAIPNGEETKSPN